MEALLHQHTPSCSRHTLSRGCLQVLSVTARGRLPQASVALMGRGMMEWSRERDRVINVSAGEP